jgi:hypothetical protein
MYFFFIFIIIIIIIIIINIIIIIIIIKDSHDITETLLKVTLNTITLTPHYQRYSY